MTKRYDRFLRALHEQTKEDEAKYFLNALALSYDPHSEYMSPSEMENFSINMRLSLVGIGAMLRSEDGYAKIIELIPGGPAASQGELKVDDKIAAVAQGNEPPVDVVDMKLDKVVDMIRGKKNTVVKLQVIPSGTDRRQQAQDHFHQPRRGQAHRPGGPRRGHRAEEREGRGSAAWAGSRCRVSTPTWTASTPARASPRVPPPT